MDWEKLLIPDESLLELIVRGTVLYLVLFTFLRLLSRREVGNFGLTDLLVLVLVADAAQNAMAGEYRSITGGMVLVAVIVGWSFVLDALAWRFPRIGRFLHPSPLRLVRDGQMLRRNMRRELITKEELTSLLREQGVEDIRQVRAAFVEVDGQLSVITRGQRRKPRRRRRRSEQSSRRAGRGPYASLGNRSSALVRITPMIWDSVSRSVFRRLSSIPVATEAGVKG